MIETFDAEGHSSLRLTGEIDLTLPDHRVARCTSVQLARDGSMRSGEGALRLALGGPIGELRKLAQVSAPLRGLLETARDADDERAGEIRLIATRSLLEELGRAAREMPPTAGVADLLSSPEWAMLLFSLDQYDPESIGVATWRLGE